MRTLAASIFLFISLISFAQESESLKESRFSMGLSFSPDYTYRTLIALPSSRVSSGVISLRNDLESPRLGFTVGALVLMRLNERISLETGIKYSDKGEKIDDLQLTYATPDPSAPDKATFIYKYQYLDVPFKVNYSLTTGRFEFFLSAGASLNLFVRSQSVARFSYADKEKIETTQDYVSLNRFNISGIIGVGFNYELLPKLHLRFEPEFLHFLTPIVPGSVIQLPYALGANVGVFLIL